MDSNVMEISGLLEELANYEKIELEIEYLALPYSTDDEFLLNFRAEVSDLIASRLIQEGRIIFAPISAWHNIAKKYKLPTNFKYWRKLDAAFIKISKRVLIIDLPGWDSSEGIKYELEIAKKFNKPVEHLDPMEYIDFLK